MNVTTMILRNVDQGKSYLEFLKRVVSPFVSETTINNDKWRKLLFGLRVRVMCNMFLWVFRVNVVLLGNARESLVQVYCVVLHGACEMG